MAPPILEIYDASDTLIPEGTPITFTGVIPGSPSAEELFSVRNNFGGGSPVDTSPNTTVRGLSRAAGDTGDPQLTGSTFQDNRASRLRVISVEGGATAKVTAFQPLGAGNVLVLDEIPDGGIVNMGWRIEATSAAALQDIDARLSVEPRLSIALADGEFEAHGNYVVDGEPGGFPDPLFSEIFEETGDWLPNVGPADDTINTPTLSTYTLQGTPETFSPGTPEITFNDEDGATVALVGGEAYYASLSYDAGGVVTVTKGLKNTAPLTEADVPTGIPGIDRVLVTVPFGLLIDTLELRGDFGFFHSREAGGLDVAISGGQGTSAGFLVIRQTETITALPDDQVSNLWQLPSGGLETTPIGDFPSGDARSLLLYEYTTAAGVITDRVSRRRIGVDSRGGVVQAASFVVDAAAANLQVVHVTLRDGLGFPVEENLEIGYFVSGDPDGIGISPDPLTDLTVGASPQSVRFLVDELTGVFGASLLGVVDVTFDETAGPSAQTFFLVIQIGARKFVSESITPNP